MGIIMRVGNASLTLHLKISGNGCASDVGQVDQLFSVGSGGLGGLLGIPDGLHLSVVCTELKKIFLENISL